MVRVILWNLDSDPGAPKRPGDEGSAPKLLAMLREVPCREGGRWVKRVAGRLERKAVQSEERKGWRKKPHDLLI